MGCTDQIMLKILSFVVCMAYVSMAHTVYRYPEKLPVSLLRHQQQHAQEQHQQKQQRYNINLGQQNAYPVPGAKYVDHSRYNTHCQYNGDIIKNPGDRCSYLECHYGEEPWHGQRRKPQLYARVRRCPPGTAVAADAKHVLFRPIQYDPTRPVYQDGQKAYNRGGYGNRGYQDQTASHYKNTYADMTAICSEAIQTKACKAY